MANDQTDLELLRAIAHARMFVTSGRGLESIIHQLVHGDLGYTSTLLAPALHQMDLGEQAEYAVRGILDREADPHMRAFLSALTATGKPAVQRLDELSESLHSEREAKAEVYGARLTGIVDMTAALFVFSFAPTMIRVLEKVPPNPIVPQISIPHAFEWFFYVFCAAIMTALVAMARAR